MKTHSLQQGSEAWHEFRSTHFGASEAAAMLGLSKYVTRDELLRMKHTGIAKEHSEATQYIFARGHETEALARTIIEQIIGEPLSPVTCSDGKLSCSCDGLNFDGNVAWEHKQFNDVLFKLVLGRMLPEEYMPQCQQVLMITGADKLIFTCSNGTEERLASMDVLPDQAWFNRMTAGWAQFQLDLETYQYVEAAPEVIAAPTKDLPALSIQVNGSISLIDNLSVFGARLKTFVAEIDMNPSDDQGFANAEAAVKTLQNAQDALEAAEASALAQTSSIDEMRKTVKLYADTARTTRLMLEKMVKARKESIRVEIAMGAKTELAAHIDTLNKRLVKVQLPPFNSDFAGVMKGKKTIASLREAVNNELVRVKLESSALADKIEINLNTLRELAKDHAFLFNDFASLVMMSDGPLTATVKLRIIEHKKAEADKAEALRVKIQAEEEAKARAKVEAEAKAKADMEAAVLAEQQRKDELAKQQSQHDPVAEASAIEEKRKQAQISEQTKPFKSGSLPVIPAPTLASYDAYAHRADRPSRAAIIGCVAAHFGVKEEVALDWILAEFRGDIEFAAQKEAA